MIEIWIRARPTVCFHLVISLTNKQVLRAGAPQQRYAVKYTRDIRRYARALRKVYKALLYQHPLSPFVAFEHTFV